MEENVFNQIANQYDTNERKELAHIITTAIKEEIQNQKRKTILDYGCGTGLVGLELSNLADEILFIDSSESMLEILKEKISQTKIENATIIDSDFTKKQIHLEVDTIIVSLVLLHIPDTNQILKFFYSILNTDGKLIIVDFDKNENISHPKVHNGFTHLELKTLLKNIGFRNAEIKSFHQGKNIFMNQDASLFISSSLK